MDQEKHQTQVNSLTPEPLAHEVLPEGDWAGMFPSEIAAETDRGFNPYDNLADRQIYREAGGNTLAALGGAATHKLEELATNGEQYPDHEDALRSLRDSARNIRGKQLRKISWPPKD